MASVALAAGCSTNQVPTTQPTTQPSEQSAFDTASAVWNTVVIAANAATIIPGLLTPAEDSAITIAIAEGNKALATWKANLGQPASVTLDAEFFSMILDLTGLVAAAKAKKAGTTVSAAKMSAHSRNAK